MTNPDRASEPGAIDVDAIKARCETATVGPWVVSKGLGPGKVPHHDGVQSVVLRPTGTRGYLPWCPVLLIGDGAYISSTDAEFIAHARTDIPALLAELARLQGVIAGMEAKQVVHFGDFHGLATAVRHFRSIAGRHAGTHNADGRYCTLCEASYVAAETGLDQSLMLHEQLGPEVTTLAPVKVGTFWVDNDPRMKGRTVKIVVVRDKSISYRNTETDRLAVSHESRFRQAFSELPDDPAALRATPVQEFRVVSIDQGAAGWRASFGDLSVVRPESEDALRELCAQLLNKDPVFVEQEPR